MLLVALFAVDRSAFFRLEGNFSFSATVRTRYLMHRPGTAKSTSFITHLLDPPNVSYILDKYPRRAKPPIYYHPLPISPLLNLSYTVMNYVSDCSPMLASRVPFHLINYEFHSKNRVLRCSRCFVSVMSNSSIIRQIIYIMVHDDRKSLKRYRV